MTGLGHPGGGTFCEQYHAYPVSFYSEKSHIEEGDKILLPSSALETLARLHVEYPMLFEVTNAAQVCFYSSEFCSWRAGRYPLSWKSELCIIANFLIGNSLYFWVGI